MLDKSLVGCHRISICRREQLKLLRSPGVSVSLVGLLNSGLEIVSDETTLKYVRLLDHHCTRDRRVILGTSCGVKVVLRTEVES